MSEESWLCYECARGCKPDDPFTVYCTGYKTFALHDRCVEAYSAKSDKSSHVPLPVKNSQ